MGKTAVRMASFLTQFRELEIALIKEPTVLDCAVRARNSENDGKEIVAYVVPSGTFSEQTVRANLQSAFPDSRLPQRYALLSGLPYASDGTLDEESLGQIEIVDEQLAKAWERRLSSLPGVEQAVVLVEPRVPIAKPLHISDLLPPAATFAVREKKQHFAPVTTTKVSSSERQKLAISVGEPLRNAAAVPLTLQGAVKRAALEKPVRDIIYVEADGSEIICSYQELLEDAEHILGGLRSLGLRLGDKVIFQLDRNQDFIPAFWACILGGYIPAPMSIAPSYKALNSTISKLHHSWELLDHPVILAGQSLSREVRNIGELLHLKKFRVESVEQLRTSPSDHHWHESQPEDIGLMLLTSGSTGLPKAVLQSHHSLLSRSAGTAQLNHFDETDVSINWFPLDHVGGIVMFHLMALFSRARQIHVPTEVILQEPLKWLDFIERYRATITWAPNFAFGLINDREKELELRRWDLSSMRFILNGGEAIVPKTARKFLQLLVRHRLRTDAMHPAWGMSETCSGVAFSDRCSLDTLRDEDSFVEVGAPIPGVSFRIVDARGQILEEEQIGRLQITGSSVTRGYYKNSELDHECFSEDGWFTTGDLGFLRDGRLTITGRAKDVIIINGVNFYSHEIEAVVEEVEGVKASFTAACPVRRADTNTDQLAIFFQASYQDWPSRLQLMKVIRETLLRKMGLNAEFLVPLSQEAIPKTAIGKIQRSTLRDRFEMGTFDPLLKEIDIESSNANTVPDWFYRESWLPRKSMVRSAALRKGTYLVFVDESGLGDLLSKQLGCEGSRCIRVSAGRKFARTAPEQYCLDPKSAADYRSLMGMLVAEEVKVDHVLHLWAYADPERKYTNQSGLRDSQDRGTYSVLLLIQAMARAQTFPQSVRLFVFTSNAQITSSDEKRGRPELAAVAGLLLTARWELPWLECRHIDLEFDVPQTNARHVMHELEISKAKTKVAYRKNQRLEAIVSKAEMIQESMIPLPIKAGGLYMVTGGLGGVGTELSKYLISRHRARLILVGRTPLFDQVEGRLARGAAEKRVRNYTAVKKTGGEVGYAALDVADVDRVRDCIANAEVRWNQPLDGIFHLAGSLSDSENLEQHWERVDARLVAAEEIESFERIFHSKLYGTWALFEAIQNRPDLLFVAFSSVNALFGGASFSAYSAANACLDSFCLAKRYGAHPLTYCFNWSMWNDLGMSEAGPEYTRELARKMGYHIIEKDQGIHSMLAGLCRRHPQLVIGLDGSNSQLREQMGTAIYPLAQMSAFYVAEDGALGKETLEHVMLGDSLGKPGVCRFANIPEMPLTENGEIDRGKLRKAIHPAAPDQCLRKPPSEMEQKVAQLWREELRLPEINLEESFFELGGDSLTAMRLVKRLRETFGVSLSVRTLFEMPTIPQMVLALGGKLQHQSDTRVQLADQDGSHSAQELLKSIDQLADEQVDALLEQMAEDDFRK